MASFDVLIYSNYHNRAVSITEHMGTGEITWIIGPDVVKGAILEAWVACRAGAEHWDRAEYYGVSLAMINQHLPEVLCIERWQ